MRYAFANVEIDLERRLMLRGGREIAVEPKVFDLLVHLILHRDRVVSKSELLDALWPDLDVMEGALSIAIHRARRLTGEFAAIRTVPRRGYRFALPVEERAGRRVPRDRQEDRSASFIGRLVELKWLSDAVAETAAGEGGVRLIIGEGGIGKTRLLEELSRRVDGSNAEILWGRAAEITSGGAFPLWRQVLAAYDARYGRDDLRALMGDALVDLAPLLPGIRRPPVRAAESSYARLRLFDAVVAFLTRASAADPLVLILDDLHLADEDSLSLLRYALRSSTRAAILFVGSAAADPPSFTTSAIGDLLEIQAVETVSLQGFNDQEAGQLLDHLAGAPVCQPVRRVVLQAAPQGNPLALVDEWQSLVETRAVVQGADGWTLRLPTQVPSRSTPDLRGAAERISAPCRQVLDACAVLGSPATATFLAKVAGLSLERFRPALREALRAGLLREVGGRSKRYSLAHVRVGNRLYALLEDGKRVTLHQRVAEELLKGSQRNRESHLAEIAHHGLAGIDAIRAERAIQYAQQAGHRAFTHLAFADAAHHLEGALAALDRFRPAARTLRWEITAALGETYIHAGDADRARAAFRDAVAAIGPAPFQPDPLPPRSVHLARFLAHLQLSLHVPIDESTTAAIDGVEARRMILEQTAAAARRSGDATGLTLAVLSQRWSAFPAAQIFERLPLSTEALFLAEGLGDAHLVQEARLFRIHDLLEHGRIDDVDSEIARYVLDADRLAEPVYAWISTYLRSMRAQVSGRLSESESLAEEAFVIGSPAVGENAAALLGSQMMGIRVCQGRATELISSIEAFTFLYPRLPVGRATLATLYCELGRLDDGRRAFESVADYDFSSAPISGVTWLSTVAGFARVCACLGDARRAEKFYQQLLPYRDTYLVVPLAIAGLGAVSAYLAVFAATAGRHREADDLFEHAVEANGKIGAWPIRAHTQYEYARALLKRGGRQRRASALTLLAAAEEVARSLELSGLLTWIEAQRH